MSKGLVQRETGASPLFEVAPVSHFWLPRLVEIDSSWNPRHWSQKLFEQELNNPFAHVKGLFCNEEICGYMIAHVTFTDAHIVSLGIESSWRRQGGARFLLQEFIRSAKVEGVTAITLEVRASNNPAQELYLSSGFEILAVKRNYYSSNGEDAISMRLVLHDEKL